MGVPADGSGVIVLSAACGAGHTSAAEAVTAAIGMAGVAVEHKEVLSLTNLIFRRFYSNLYLQMVNKSPQLFGWAYEMLDKPWQYQKHRLVIDRFNSGRLVKWIKQKQPGAAICTHFLPAEILLHLRRRGDIDMRIGIVVTDLDAHAMWLYEDVDWYFVACDETKIYLEKLGVPSKNIHVTGIPVHPVFSNLPSKAAARARLGMDPDFPAVLVMAGGFGMGPVEKIVESLDCIQTPIQIGVICGKNEDLLIRVRDMMPLRHPCVVSGFTKEINVWMAASDVYLGKAGGLSSSEALASGLVLVIVNPIPGQEERNSDHFLEEGVAIRCNNLPALAYKVEKLLRDTKRLETMRKAARKFAKPAAAMDIARIVVSETGK